MVSRLLDFYGLLCAVQSSHYIQDITLRRDGPWRGGQCSCSGRVLGWTARGKSAWVDSGDEWSREQWAYTLFAAPGSQTSEPGIAACLGLF